MSLLEVLEGKKVEDFTREELVSLANENEISFKETSKDSTIFNKLVKFVSAPKTIKIKVLSPLAGKYLLSHNIGEVVSMEEKQATELVENKDAEFVK